MRTLAIVNQKGGCGKTTTAINLAAVYARRGLRTLLVDLDPQAHCAAGLGVPEGTIEYSIGDALRADLGAASGGLDVEGLIWEVGLNLELAPSTMRLAALEAPGGGLHEMPERDRRLELVLQRLAPRYDCCFIDCPPTIGLLTFNALRATREVIIPVETGYFAMRGAQKQWETIQRVIQRIGRPIACHLLATMHDPESSLAREILAAMRRQFAGQILPCEVRLHEALRQAASMGQAITEFAPESEARQDYETLADWLDEHACRPGVEIEVRPGLMPEGPGRGWAADGEHGGEHGQALCVDGQARPAGSTASTGTVSGQALSGGGQALSGESSRAAELAGRLRGLARSLPATPDLDPDAESGEMPAPPDSVRPAAGPVSAPAAVAPPPTETGVSLSARPISPVVVVADEPPISARVRSKVQHLFGVRHTAQGVLFVQPLDGGARFAVAGDFNGWSSTATPLRRNEALGVAQALVRLPAGRHCYRLVIDGRWMADPWNETTDANPHGELNSVVEVAGSPDGDRLPRPAPRPQEDTP